MTSVHPVPQWVPNTHHNLLLHITPLQVAAAHRESCFGKQNTTVTGFFKFLNNNRKQHAINKLRHLCIPGKTVSTGSGWTITNLSADSWSGLLKWCRTFVDLFLQNVLLWEMKFAKLRKRLKQTLHSQMILHSFKRTSTTCKKDKDILKNRPKLVQDL